jgi:hypothetical protein
MVDKLEWIVGQKRGRRDQGCGRETLTRVCEDLRIKGVTPKTAEIWNSCYSDMSKVFDRIRKQEQETLDEWFQIHSNPSEFWMSDDGTSFSIEKVPGWRLVKTGPIFVETYITGEDDDHEDDDHEDDDHEDDDAPRIVQMKVHLQDPSYDVIARMIPSDQFLKVLMWKYDYLRQSTAVGFDPSLPVILTYNDWKQSYR